MFIWPRLSFKSSHVSNHVLQDKVCPLCVSSLLVVADLLGVQPAVAYSGLWEKKGGRRKDGVGRKEEKGAERGRVGC